MRFSEGERKRIIWEGRDTELFKAIVDQIEVEREELLRIIDDLDGYPEVERDDLIRKRGYLKWLQEMPERAIDKPEIEEKPNHDPYN